MAAHSGRNGHVKEGSETLRVGISFVNEVEKILSSNDSLRNRDQAHPVAGRDFAGTDHSKVDPRPLGIAPPYTSGACCRCRSAVKVVWLDRFPSVLGHRARSVGVLRGQRDARKPSIPWVSRATAGRAPTRASQAWRFESFSSAGAPRLAAALTNTKLAGCVSNIAKRTLMEIDQNREEVEFYDEMKDLFWRRFASIQRDESLPKIAKMKSYLFRPLAM